MKRHAYERHACEMAYERCMPMREMHAYERHACGMTYVRSMPMRDASVRWPLMRDTPMKWPMGEARI